jgi:hypothetical protein
MAIFEDLEQTEEIVEAPENNPEVEHVTVVPSYDDEDVYLKVWLYETVRGIKPIMDEYGLSIGTASLDYTLNDDRWTLMVTLGVDG